MGVAGTPVQIGGRTVEVLDLPALLGSRLPRLPHVLRLLAENHIRHTSGRNLAALCDALDALLSGTSSSFELSFRPNRLLMHDTTCTPALADVAGLMDALAEAGGDPAALFPTLPVEVSVDHSLSVDLYARPDAFKRNSRAEMRRNAERYRFMKWASQSMRNLRVNPPGTGIMHTINLEQLATVLVLSPGGELSHPDMLLGTDSHTPMINGIGVLGWGIGGLEAESIMFGQTASLAMPEVIGVRLEGALAPGVLSTDLALKVTHELRGIGVAGAFVEFFGPGVATLSADDRAVIANMAPEYGATTGFFPVDLRTIDYLRRTGRPDELTAAIEPVFRAMGLWFDPGAHPNFGREITIDLAALQPSLAGPRRPQDLLATSQARKAIETVLDRPLRDLAGDEVPDGAVGVAAITSCTNTSDPRLLVAAGLVARKARARGLTPKPWVKTSFAPGSPSARDVLSRVGLLDDLAAVGFDIVGFGCTTCIGNSGPLPDVIQDALGEGAAVAAVLSGNRNFPGRVHPSLDLGFLASPPLVVAYALRGDIRGDILTAPIGQDVDGSPVQLSEIWPAEDEIDAATRAAIDPHDVPAAFRRAATNEDWARLDAPNTNRFPWDPASRYLRRPKFASLDETTRLGTYSAAPLLVLGDDMTTDHISPAGRIDAASEAGRWLTDRGASAADLNVFAAYRGNWEVMLRGLYTNRLAINHLASDAPAGWTIVDGGQEAIPLYLAAEHYRGREQATVVLAGELYGMGSSRDWAAKGVALLGARAIIARSFERIHRTNLIGMGILPLRIEDDFVPATAGLAPTDRIEIDAPAEALATRGKVSAVLRRADGRVEALSVSADVETQQEVETLRIGGILPAILRSRLG